MTALDGVLTRQDWNHTADLDFTAALAQVPLFGGLNRRQLRKTARHAELATFLPGDVALDSDTSPDYFYVVLRGAAELRDEGRTRRVRRGDYFGETALLEGTDDSATVIATDELHVLRLPAPVVLELARRSPSVSYAILTQLGRRMQRQAPQRISRAA
jgi:CRP/FNR family transcriptional regulator, cyclic AMP receptor protein